VIDLPEIVMITTQEWKTHEVEKWNSAYMSPFVWS